MGERTFDEQGHESLHAPSPRSDKPTWKPAVVRSRPCLCAKLSRCRCTSSQGFDDAGPVDLFWHRLRCQSVCSPPGEVPKGARAPDGGSTTARTTRQDSCAPLLNPCPPRSQQDGRYNLPEQIRQFSAVLLSIADKIKVSKSKNDPEYRSAAITCFPLPVPSSSRDMGYGVPCPLRRMVTLEQRVFRDPGQFVRAFLNRLTVTCVSGACHFRM